jgi:phosphatidylcholine synthase
MPDSISSTVEENDRKDTALAWSVHLFTASGAVWGFLALLAIIQGRWQLALGWMALAAVVDSVDGMLARRYRVKDVLPLFDGALLDNMVDYFTYTIVPALLLYQADLLPPNWSIFGIAVMVLASSYQFAQGDAKSDGDNHFFKGFPSYWNVLVFYLLMLEWGIWANLGLVLFFSVMVFVPIKYIYQSRTTHFRKLTLGLSALWGVASLIILITFPNHSKVLLYGSMLYIVYYAVLSIYLMRKYYSD